MQNQFDLKFNPSHVIFGEGSLARAGEMIEALGCRKALVLTTPAQSAEGEKLAHMLGARSAGLYTRAAMHTPLDVTEDALNILRRSGADCTLAYGGGSTTGLGKALAYRTDMPQIVIPTTYAGSEVTPILGQTEKGVKTTVSDAKILPEIVIYDPGLTASLPYAMSVTSALNALAHAAEALYAQNRNPIATLMAAQGAKALIEALPLIKQDLHHADGRRKLLYGAWLCGTVLGMVGMALHHKLCHTLGGAFDLPHAETHAIILPHALAFNAVAAGDQLAPLQQVLTEYAKEHDQEDEKRNDLASGIGESLYAFAKACSAPLALKDLGMPVEGIARASELAVANPYWNPRSFERAQIERLIENAYYGRVPEEL